MKTDRLVLRLLQIALINHSLTTFGTLSVTKVVPSQGVSIASIVVHQFFKQGWCFDRVSLNLWTFCKLFLRMFWDSFLSSLVPRFSHVWALTFQNVPQNSSRIIVWGWDPTHLYKSKLKMFSILTLWECFGLCRRVFSHSHCRVSLSIWWQILKKVGCQFLQYGVLMESMSHLVSPFVDSLRKLLQLMAFQLMAWLIKHLSRLAQVAVEENQIKFLVGNEFYIAVIFVLL